MDITPASDRTAPLTASNVMRSDFRRARRGGFDEDEVAQHLGTVAEHMADLEERIRELESRMQENDRAVASEEAGRHDAYEDVATRIADLLKIFDDDVERMRGDAQHEADRLLQESQAEAERSRSEAEKLSSEAAIEAERLVRDAEQRAESILSDLRARRAGLLEDCRRIREALVRATSSMDSVLTDRSPEVAPTGYPPVRD
jgi:cell division septum initiation protein DivIVA